MSFILVAAAGALCAAFASAAAAEPALSLPQAVDLAARDSRLIAAASAQADAARQMALAAGQRPDPVLKAGLNNLPIDGADRFSTTRDSMTMRSVSLMQELTRSDKRAARAARLEREGEAALAGRAVVLADVRRDTALAWLDRHFQERLRELLHAQRAEVALQIDAAEAAYRGGRGAQADVFGARAALAQLDDRISQADLQVATATTRLARWVGAAATQPLAAPPELSAVSIDAAGLETQLEHHPQIALLARQEAMARADVDVAQSAKRADWSVEMMLSQRGSAYSNMVSLNVSIPLQWDQANRQDREVAARLALAEQVRAQRDDTLREHLAQTRNWLQQWQNGRARLQRHAHTLIPLAAERTRAALAAYRGGSGTLIGVLDARRAEIDARIERLRVEMETAALWAQLEYLIAPEHGATAALHGNDSQEARQ